MDDVREQMARLSSLRRESASRCEREAARIVGDELARAGLAAHVEHERVHGTFWWPLGLLNVVGALTTLAGRRASALVGAAAGAALADEMWVGRRWLRRLLRRRWTANVWAEVGSGRTLVIHAHHDAAHTGLVFRPVLVRGPGSPGRRRTPPPLSWIMVAAPVLGGAGALAGIRPLRVAAATVSTITAALMADVGRSDVVPGANDNASGVVSLICLARALAASPPRRLRVVLLSTGAEESPLEGMEAWMRRHAPDPGTMFLCLDGLASERLVVVDGEGMLKLHRYPAEPRETIASCAEELGVDLDRFSFRFATDGQVALRRGYPAAALSSIDEGGAPRNYHLPSDDVDHADCGTLFEATRLVLELVRRLDKS